MYAAGRDAGQRLLTHPLQLRDTFLAIARPDSSLFALRLIFMKPRLTADALVDE
jgi:hypothetical protein